MMSRICSSTRAITAVMPRRIIGAVRGLPDAESRWTHEAL